MTHTRTKIVAACAGGLVALAAAGCGAEDAGGTPTPETKYPTRTVQLMAPAAPGGGWDSTARSMQKALKDANLTSEAVEVFNVPGAAGTVGLAQLVTKGRGDPHQLMVTGLVMVGGVVTNKSAVSLADTTPVATLTAEAEVIVVRADSKYTTLQQLIADWKTDPAAVKWGGGSAGGTDHILVGMLAKAVGVDPKGIKYVPYAGGGEAKAALLSGDLVVGVSGVSEFADLVAAGKLRALAVSDAKSQTVGGATTPSIKDTGVDVELMNWRGLVAAPGISAAERAAISGLVDRMHSSEAWKQALTRQGWQDFYKTGDAATSFYTSESTRIKGVLTDIGLAG
ncbi:MAG TPA: tripartite tricarboxylate transporter substrate-binding protein [Pilimelia sp.]|nr:tripartite tricarboxylate transporter substrate-binding protein [Pilimelia sp.]